MSKPSILERVKEMTRQALEREAEKLLALDVVKKRISDAAGEGFSNVTVTPEKAIDLSQTATAKATIKELQGEGFSVEWERRQCPDGRTLKTLVLKWQ